MKNKLKLISVMSVWVFLLACQSTPKPVSKSSSKSSSKAVPYLTTQITQRSVPVIRSQDGVQDIRWTITNIKTRPAVAFQQMPFIQLNSAQKRLQGSTGCNPVFGTYQMDFSQKTLTFDVKAAHMSCDNALSQEADLMDALARTKYFNIKGKQLELLDQNGQRLIELQQR